MPGVEGSPEFNAEYDRLLASVVNVRRASSVGRRRCSTETEQAHDGTFVDRYRASDFFAHPHKPNLKEKPLSEGTQDNYRLGLDLMHAQGMTSGSFAELTAARQSLHQKVRRESGGAAAALQKTLLSNLWQFASVRRTSMAATASTR